MWAPLEYCDLYKASMKKIKKEITFEKIKTIIEEVLHKNGFTFITPDDTNSGWIATHINYKYSTWEAFPKTSYGYTELRIDIYKKDGLMLTFNRNSGERKIFSDAQQDICNEIRDFIEYF